MGHITDPEKQYHFLQQRLTQKVQANPGSPTLMRILRVLFSPEDAALAGKLPHNLTPVKVLAKNLKVPEHELSDKLTDMAQRGIVFDMECHGQRYVTLPPVVIGFFEFVFMRARPDIPMKELAHLFEQYFAENDGALARSLWQGHTQLARTFIREEAIPENDHAEVLDWERATHIIATANLNKGVVSSNWIMEVDRARCKGCGECAKACPVEAISLAKAPQGDSRKKWAVRNAEVCLGCGLCCKVCKSGGAVMRPRPRRVLAPETIFDQRVAMAIERGRLADMLFDDPGKLSHRALGRLIGMLEKTPPFKAAMACESIKSAFLNALVQAAKKQAGMLAEPFT